MALSDSEQTVAKNEKFIEHQPAKSSFPKIPDTKKYTTALVSNFTCLACGSILQEAVSVNGEVRGWCGNSRAYVKQMIPVPAN